MGHLTADGRSLIWNLRIQKGWGSWCMMKAARRTHWTYDMKTVEDYDCI